MSFAIHAELNGAMLAIEIANKKGWRQVWLECDSQLVVSVFSSISIVPWQQRNRWVNCLEITKSMNFRVSHIFREDNSYADKIASLGFSVDRLHWWDTIPRIISEDFFRNRISLPNYRFK